MLIETPTLWRFRALPMSILAKAIVAIPAALVVGRLAADNLTSLWMDTVHATLRASGF